MTLKNYRPYIFALAFSFMLFAYAAMAQVDPMAPVPTDEFLRLLLASVGGFSGASALTVVGVVVQLLVALAKTPLMGSLFSKIDGIYKVIIVLSLTLIGGVITLVTVEHLSWGAALIHSTTLSALMVLGNQIYQQFMKAKAPTPPVK